MASNTVLIGGWAATLFIISRLIGYLAALDTRRPYRNDLLISFAVYIALIPTLPIFIGLFIE